MKVAASSVNPTDVRVVAGDFRPLVELEFPYVLGNDFAGTVTEVGAGVTQYQTGDEVFGQAMPRQLGFVASPNRPSLSTGAMAEYAVFEADTALLAHRPAGVPVEQAAALGIVGMTARALLALTKIQPGETVLVIGATGGVGTAVLPLLVDAQAQVVATARTEAGAEVVRGLGAQEVIGVTDYPAEVDVVFNLVLPAERLGAAVKSLRPGGRLVTIVFPPPSPEAIGREDVEVLFLMDPEGEHGGMPDVAEAAASGLLKARIAGQFSLDEGVQAVVAFARQNPMGKIVVTM